MPKICPSNLSGKSYVSFLKELKKRGYSVSIFFLWIPSAELALSRIKDRVASGGHDVPAIDVRRRFHRGLSNFLRYYKPLADTWLLFNNADVTPKLIAKERNGEAEVVDKELFGKIAKLARQIYNDKKGITGKSV